MSTKNRQILSEGIGVMTVTVNIPLNYDLERCDRTVLAFIDHLSLGAHNNNINRI